MERFAMDGFRCVRIKSWYQVGLSEVTRRSALRAASGRCPNQDVTRTGRGLVCNHKTYARFRNENVETDLETVCVSCDREQEAIKRPWNTSRGRLS
jgi:hypothetical protein